MITQALLTGYHVDSVVMSVSRLRFGLDAGDDLSSGELADRPPERRHPRGVEREQK